MATKKSRHLRSDASRPGGAQPAPRNAASRRVRSSAKTAYSEIGIIHVAGNWTKSIRNCKIRIQQWCEAGLAGARNGCVSVVLADDDFVRNLNHQYRGKNKPTNVLSFPGEGDELGDIVLAYETVKREAAGQKKAFANHTAHLIVHGVLHLRGFDHEDEDDAEKMESREIAILAKFGIQNPYEVY